MATETNRAAALSLNSEVFGVNLPNFLFSNLIESHNNALSAKVTTVGTVKID